MEYFAPRLSHLKKMIAGELKKMRSTNECDA